MPRIEAAICGRARGRLHRAVDEPLADRGVHPDPADGRHRRPAVPRIRHDAVGRDPDLAGRLADDDADDVRPAARRTPRATARPASIASAERFFAAMLRGYDRTLGWALDHPRARSWRSCSATVGLNVYLYIDRPQGLLPAAGHRPHHRRHPGRPEHLVPADAAEAAAVHRRSSRRIRRSSTAVGFTGGGQTNSGFVFMSLKPLSERKMSADQVIRRLRGQLAQVAGATLFLQAVQDIRVGGRAAQRRSTSTRCRPTPSTSSTPGRRRSCADCRRCRSSPTSTPTSRTTGSRPTSSSTATPRRGSGITVAQIDNTLYDAFGQRQVSTIYNDLNQYHVVMEVAPQYWQNPETLEGHLRQHVGRLGRRHASDATRSPAPSAAMRGAGRAPRQPRAPRTVAADAARNLAPNSIGNTGQGRRLDRRGGQHQRGNHGAAERGHPFRARQHAARRQPPGPVRRHHDLVQSRARRHRSAMRSTAVNEADDPARRAGHHPRQLPGHGAGLPGSRCATSPGSFSRR